MSSVDCLFRAADNCTICFDPRTDIDHQNQLLPALKSNGTSILHGGSLCLLASLARLVNTVHLHRARVALLNKHHMLHLTANFAVPTLMPVGTRNLPPISRVSEVLKSCVIPLYRTRGTCGGGGYKHNIAGRTFSVSIFDVV